MNIADEELRIEPTEAWWENPKGMKPVAVPHGVKVVHSPTGLTAFSDSARSQLRNLNICKAMLAAGLDALARISSGGGGAERQGDTPTTAEKDANDKPTDSRP